MLHNPSDTDVSTGSTEINTEINWGHVFSKTEPSKLNDCCLINDPKTKKTKGEVY